MFSGFFSDKNYRPRQWTDDGKCSSEARWGTFFDFEIIRCLGWKIDHVNLRVPKSPQLGLATRAPPTTG